MGWAFAGGGRLEGKSSSVNEFQSNRPLNLSDHPFLPKVRTLRIASIMDKSINEARLDLALADLANQRPPNYMVTAKLYQVNRTTLRRRFLGTQQERSTSRVDSHQRLSEAQEETLIGFINSLTDRSLPPTSQIVHNCAEELIGERLNKNWVSVT